jgi:spore germination protein YaaH
MANSWPGRIYSPAMPLLSRSFLARRTRLFATALALPTFASVAPAQAPSAAPVPAVAIPRAERLFYYVDRESSWDSFSAHVDQIGIVAPQTYSVDSLGIVFGDVDPSVVALAQAHGVRVMPLVVNEGFNQRELHQLLTDSAAQRRATGALVALCRSHHYWGMQFDVEDLGITDRDRFTAFYSSAARALRDAGFAVSIAIVPRAGDLAGATTYDRWMFDSWRGGYDLGALARASDFVSWMTYDQHTRRTPPGAVAGLPWMRASVDFALRSIPAAKLSLGVPIYSDHWYVQADPGTTLRAGVTGTSVSYTWGMHLLERAGGTLQWDDTQKAAFGIAPVGGVNTWLFFDDVRSFAAQSALVSQYRLRGISAWVLGMEDPRIWDALAAGR